MNPFEYATPQSEAETLELLNDHHADTAVLAGGTDLIRLLQEHLLSPQRVVDINTVASFQGVSRSDGGVLIGAMTTLEDALASPLLAGYRSVGDVIDGIHSLQIQQMGTVGGDLCHMPNCWYYRNGYGLFGMENGESLVAAGDNRYHAIIGNSGPAKFVSASRFAPAAIAWGGRVRVIGPERDQEEWLPLEYFYITPKTERQGVTVLQPGQLISHLWLPETNGVTSGTYEVLQMQGLDWPLASAAACLELSGNKIRDARIVLGHVAPVPWVARDAATAIIGRSLNEETAQLAGDVAIAGATPLSKNGYKVQLARTAVKRALLRAAEKLEGVL
jgi:xanthine dehydrogenase YagS FAD-binding subunit